MVPLSSKTDWNKYYATPISGVTQITRSVLIRHLSSLFNRHLVPPQGSFIIELGGGNSILLPVFESFFPSKYLIFDNCLTGIQLFNEKTKNIPWAKSEVKDLMTNLDIVTDSDLTVSVGLIEHFSSSERKDLIDRHFACTRKGGLVVMTFPTPTFLYRVCRRFLEFLGKWNFPDETPLAIDEVLPQLKSHGEILSVHILWPQMLTQAVVAIRKFP